jgi:hypothetical protein
VASPNLITDCTAWPSFPEPDKIGYSGSLIKFEDEASVAIVTCATKNRSFKLHYKNQTIAQKTSFESFFDARVGPSSTFYFNTPFTSDILVRFVEWTVEFVLDSPTTYSWNANLTRVTS